MRRFISIVMLGFLVTLGTWQCLCHSRVTLACGDCWTEPTVSHSDVFPMLRAKGPSLCNTPSFTAQLCHTPSSPPHVSHTQLCQTPSFVSFATPSFTRHFGTHHLSHTVTDHLSHTFFDTSSFTHTTLSYTIFHHTIFHTHTHNFVTHTHTIFLCHTPSFTDNFVTHNFFYFSILHHLLCLSRPRYNICCS